ncbi:hypothetical protein BDE40_2674 [Litoreibacter halocynthiae]|uniref:Tetratricopeptide repeat protein n=1 Tax=Litoreibacter halocynthiae TaxID=1242689 RepID=A0A4R7LHB2_9RHOB|nr:hypothetical protein [Litoreibacter halocynthiae]TDT73896.1 hypothetical protein BDE40_2674 [Litoreibacter halocynthiae]
MLHSFLATGPDIFPSVRRCAFGASLAAFVALAPQAFANNLGKVDFETSCTVEADEAFDQGLTLLHHMMYFQAEGVFAGAAERSPECAMLHWGVAMSKFHPLWPGRPSPEKIAAGQAAVERMKVAEPGSDIEQAFTEAAEAYYEGANTPYPERIASWAAAQIKAFEEFPENDDVTAFHALALLATAPRGDKTMANQRKAGALMEDLDARTEMHPAVYHYAIHAYDNPVLYENALSYANDYGKIAPDVPHALHMPSHIFVRAGQWDQVIEWNARSARVALAEPLNGVISNHYAHAMDYWIYAVLQKGDFEQAEKLLGEFVGYTNQQDNFGAAYALAASPVRVALEQEQWERLAGMSGELHPAISWEKFPQTVAMRWFAIGLGAARSDNLTRANEALRELADLRQTLEAGKQGYWLKLVEAQILSIEAWVELSRGNTDLAIELQTKAADIEDAVGKSPVTPGHVLPARELLGDLFTQAGNSDLAAGAYRDALKDAPNRLRSTLALK